MWATSFATNVTGVFLSVQSLLAQLQTGKNAKIAIISSQMASDERAPGGSYIYRSSKAAALNLGRNLAVDLKGIGIAVGIYHPVGCAPIWGRHRRDQCGTSRYGADAEV